MGPAERRLRAALHSLRSEQVRRRSAAWAREARLVDRAASRVQEVSKTLVDDRLLGARTRAAAETALHGFAGVLDERWAVLDRAASLLREAADQMESTRRQYAALGDPPQATTPAAVLGAGAGDAAAVRETRTGALYRDLEAGLARVEERLRALLQDPARGPVEPRDDAGVHVTPPDPGGSDPGGSDPGGGAPEHPGDGHGAHPSGSGGPATASTVADPAPSAPLTTTPFTSTAPAPGQDAAPNTGVTPAASGPGIAAGGLPSGGLGGAPTPPDPITVDAALPAGAGPPDWWRVEQSEPPVASPAAAAPIAAAGVGAGVAGAARSLAGVGAIPFRASSAGGARQTSRPARRGRRGRRRLLRDGGGDRPIDPTGEPPNDGVLR